MPHIMMRASSQPFSRLPLSGDEAKAELTIGAREGRYPGIRGVEPDADVQADYDGAALAVPRRAAGAS